MKKLASLLMIGVLALPLTVSTVAMAQDAKDKKADSAAADAGAKKKGGKKKGDKKGKKEDKGAKSAS
jgi:hypothetical protein